MQKKTDLYIFCSTRTARLKFIEIFDKNFLFDSERSYSGYLGINVDRIKMVSIVLDMKNHNVDCLSVPVDYRDRENITLTSAFNIASEFAKKHQAVAIDAPYLQSKCPPLYWIFDLKYESSIEEKNGGVVMVDRIDGHVWSSSEYEEYMYDYNNSL